MILATSARHHVPKKNLGWDVTVNEGMKITYDYFRSLSKNFQKKSTKISQIHQLKKRILLINLILLQFS
jgi:hypothetical protein